MSDGSTRDQRRFIIGQKTSSSALLTRVINGCQYLWPPTAAGFAARDDKIKNCLVLVTGIGDLGISTRLAGNHTADLNRSSLTSGSCGALCSVRARGAGRSSCASCASCTGGTGRSSRTNTCGPNRTGCAGCTGCARGSSGSSCASTCGSRRADGAGRTSRARSASRTSASGAGSAGSANSSSNTSGAGCTSWNRKVKNMIRRAGDIYNSRSSSRIACSSISDSNGLRRTGCSSGSSRADWSSGAYRAGNRVILRPATRIGTWVAAAVIGIRMIHRICDAPLHRNQLNYGNPPTTEYAIGQVDAPQRIATNAPLLRSYLFFQLYRCCECGRAFFF